MMAGEFITPRPAAGPAHRRFPEPHVKILNAPPQPPRASGHRHRRHGAGWHESLTH